MNKKHFVMWLLAATLIVISAACAKENQPSNTPVPTSTVAPTNTPTPTNSATPTPTPTDTPTPTPSNTPTPVVRQVKINAVGDVFFGSHQNQPYNRSFFQYYDKYGADYHLKNVKEIFEADDFTLVNYEGTLTESTDIQDKTWNHKGRPVFAEMLPAASIEGATLANNHIMDYGPQGTADTFANLSAVGVVYAISSDYGMQYGLYETPDGVKIGFVSVNEHHEGTRCNKYLEEGYNYLKEQGANIIIACPHWGLDKTYTVTKAQQTMGRYCIDLGYDAVLGCHAHYLQPIEKYKGKYIVYGMGNFCYGGNKNPEDKDSVIIQLNVTLVDGVVEGEIDFTFIPCSLSSSTDKNDYCPKVLTGDDAKALIDRFNKRIERFNVTIDYDGKPVVK